MANNEAQFRVEIIASARKWGQTHAISINDQFLIGRPDVYIANNGSSLWLELKYLHFVNPLTTYKVFMSPAQRSFLKAEQAAGCMAGWVLCVKINNIDGRKGWQIFAGANSDAEHATMEDFVEMKMQGEALDWNIAKISYRISKEQYGYPKRRSH